MVGMVECIYIFFRYGQIVTEIKQGEVGSPGFMAMYPYSVNLNI